MLRTLCCCVSGSDERQPLLHSGSPSEANGAESARRLRPVHTDSQSEKRNGQLVMKRVNVPELDRRFTDMAEAFNEQQEHYQAMARHIRELKQSCGCDRDNSLAFSECLKKLMKEQESVHRVSLKMEGYDFSLSVDPSRAEREDESEALPPNVQQAQREVKGASDSAKATISRGTALLELIGWLLRSHAQMAEQVKAAAETYQERGRLSRNLEENMKEARRAKEQSLGFRQQAGEVYIEAAQIAGLSL